MPYIDDYPNIKKIFELLEDKNQINILLGIEKTDDKRTIHHITALRVAHNKIIISGLFIERYFSYEIMIKEDGELINTSQCYEPLFISFNMINRIISGVEYISMNDNIYNTCSDKEYLDSLHEGLEYIIDLNESYISFQKDDKEIIVYVNYFHSIKEDKSIYGISFINKEDNNYAITIYFDKESKTICYGYLSRFINTNNRKGFFIKRDMEEVINELKNMSVL